MIRKIVVNAENLILMFVLLLSLIIIVFGYIDELEDRVNVLENFTNINNYDLNDFEASRLPLWRQCFNGEQAGEPLAYAWVLVNKDYMVKVPEDQLAYKNGTLWSCK